MVEVTRCLEAVVRYGPKHEIVSDDAGVETLVPREGEATVRVPASEVALVMIDVWSTRDPAVGAPPPSDYANLARLLGWCRQAGVTIIHAPSEPVASRYAQYHRLAEEVDRFLAAHASRGAAAPAFMRWPPTGNEVYARSHELRKRGREPAYAFRGDARKDLSRFIDVSEEDFFVATHEQFRYVLWRRGVTVLLYAGGSVHECMLHRDAGLNLIAGSDTRTAKFTPIVMEDCAFIGPYTNLDGDTMRACLLEYYKHKLAFLGHSQRIAFCDVPADQPLRDVIEHPCPAMRQAMR